MCKTVREGGCLCGAVRYRAAGEPLYVAYCHCSLCRRASGAPVVAWAGFPDSAFAFIAGEAAFYDSSPQAARRFCSRCGTALTFRLHAESNVDITLASLDDPETLRPAHHVFAGNKLDWVRIGDDLPQYKGWKHEEKA